MFRVDLPPESGRWETTEYVDSKVLAELRYRIEVLENLLEQVKLKAITAEWPDCGKSYWYCELCGECTNKGQSVDELKHEEDCLIPKIIDTLYKEGVW